MTATLSRFKSRNPQGAIPATVIIGLLLAPAFIKIHSDQIARAETASEYQTGRSFILSKIDAAAESHDMATLLHLHQRYAGCVADTKFTTSLKSALATATARETELELVVSKHLDLTRHREEFGARNETARPLPLDLENDRQQRLSQLPR